MSDMEPVSDSDIQQVSAAWLAARSADESVDDWVEDWQDERRIQGDYMAMWRFVLRLCDDVQDNDSDTIGMIGVDPLWSMVNRWPDVTFTLLEGDAAKNLILLKALSSVITDDPAVRDRLDAILARQ
ncbi:MAG TPA: hypothetical protein VG147_09160 [Solirubrobacteraceae bacterium]|nr:hypothetical protein [Solirubrobacteraceae bacterium]